MKKTITLAAILLLVAAVGLAQDPSASPSTQSTPSSTQSGTQSIRGCLSGSEGNFTLASDSGQTIKLSGDDALLKQHVGHMVDIKGLPEQNASDASAASTGSSQPQTFAVNDVQMISESCTQTSGAASTEQNATTAGTTAESAPSSTTPDQSAPAAGTTSTEPSATGTQPATTPDQTASAAAGTTAAPEANPQASTEPVPSSDVAAGQPATSSEAAGMQEQQAPAGTTATEQPAAPATEAPAQEAAQAPVGEEKQGTGVAQNQLPQTASPLPLLGLLGLGSLVAGFVSRRKK